MINVKLKKKPIMNRKFIYEIAKTDTLADHLLKMGSKVLDKWSLLEKENNIIKDTAAQIEKTALQTYCMSPLALAYPSVMEMIRGRDDDLFI